VKREEVVAGAEYATDLGVHVRVEPEPPNKDGSPTVPSAGWTVQGRKWVKAEEYGQRLVKGGVYKAYQTNVAIRAVEVDTKRKIVIEPRRLVATWEDHLKEIARLKEVREAAEANAHALLTRASKAAVKVNTDVKKEEVRLSFGDFDTLLRKAKV
jgi:hypothetical protein